MTVIHHLLYLFLHHLIHLRQLLRLARECPTQLFWLQHFHVRAPAAHPREHLAPFSNIRAPDTATVFGPGHIFKRMPDAFLHTFYYSGGETQFYSDRRLVSNPNAPGMFQQFLLVKIIRNIKT